MRMSRYKKCGCKVFLIDETITIVEVDGELGKQIGPGELNNRNCVKCTYTDQYETYKYLYET
jgi:hypothetical protein